MALQPTAPFLRSRGSVKAAHAHLEDCNLAAEVAHAVDCDRAEPRRLGADPCELEAVSCDRL
eukprot:scaffold96777_cov63-Phaeocystis_antarctica.AAC.1